MADEEIVVSEFLRKIIRDCANNSEVTLRELTHLNEMVRIFEHYEKCEICCEEGTLQLIISAAIGGMAIASIGKFCPEFDKIINDSKNRIL